jgi:hypothetical protein
MMEAALLRGRPPLFFSLTGGSEARDPLGAVSSKGNAITARNALAATDVQPPSLHVHAICFGLI